MHSAELTRYGWTGAFARHFETYAEHHPDHAPARVIEQQRGSYRVVCDDGEYAGALSGRFAHEADLGGYPVVGDWVAASLRPDERGATIHAVLPRATVFRRKAPDDRLQVIAANLDVALIAAALNGDLSARRIERYLAVAREGGAAPIVVLTKADLCEDVPARRAEIDAVAGGAPVIALSSLTGDGVIELAAQLSPGRTAALLGSSGVGKSTLLNALAGETLMHTAAISGDDKRGRHTTTHRELFVLPSGALILDSPGMREMAVWGADDGVSATFEDVAEIVAACRFSDCRHRGEPSCAVAAAFESGALTEDRWRGFEKLQRELAYEARKEDPLLRAETRRVWIQRQKRFRAQKKARDEDD